MATFKICVFEHQKRIDGKYPVSIRIYFKGQSAYLKTNLYVTDQQINKKTFTLKDPFVIKECNARIAKYESLKVNKLGYNIELYTAKELAEYFKKEGAPGTDSSIDFIEFARLYKNRLINKGKKSTADTLRCTINAMVDFCGGREKISITEINVKFLNQFEDYLRGARTLKRVNQFGRIVTTKRKGVSDITIMDYMTNVRTIFNAAIDEFNDEDRGDVKIKHYPFRKYKLRKGPEPNKRVLSIEQIRSIRDVSDTLLIEKRSILSRDVFMLSFLLAGCNTADLFDVKKSAYKSGRLSYYRQKTRDRRQDRAYISLRVYPEALPFFEKYKDPKGERVFRFYKMYSNSQAFNANLNKGLKHVAKVCNIEERLSTYFARFSFASIARNECGISKDDINMSLDHVDASLKMADVYIKKDWSIIDRVVRAVLDLLNK